MRYLNYLVKIHSNKRTLYHQSIMSLFKCKSKWSWEPVANIMVQTMELRHEWIQQAAAESQEIRKAILHLLHSKHRLGTRWGTLHYQPCNYQKFTEQFKRHNESKSLHLQLPKVSWGYSNPSNVNLLSAMYTAVTTAMTSKDVAELALLW